MGGVKLINTTSTSSDSYTFWSKPTTYGTTTGNYVYPGKSSYSGSYTIDKENLSLYDEIYINSVLNKKTTIISSDGINIIITAEEKITLNKLGFKLDKMTEEEIKEQLMLIRI
jgi:hypothetical protein